MKSPTQAIELFSAFAKTQVETFPAQTKELADGRAVASRHRRADQVRRLQTVLPRRLNGPA